MADIRDLANQIQNLSGSSGIAAARTIENLAGQIDTPGSGNTGPNAGRIAGLAALIARDARASLRHNRAAISGAAQQIYSLAQADANYAQQQREAQAAQQARERLEAQEAQAAAAALQAQRQQAAAAAQAQQEKLAQEKLEAQQAAAAAQERQQAAAQQAAANAKEAAAAAAAKEAQQKLAAQEANRVPGTTTSATAPRSPAQAAAKPPAATKPVTPRPAPPAAASQPVATVARASNTRTWGDSHARSQLDPAWGRLGDTLHHRMPTAARNLDTLSHRNDLGWLVR